MIKRIVCLMLACLLAAGTACAQDAGQEQAKQSMLNLLTEVYGYTAEEADAFEMEAEESFDVWKVKAWPKEHPEWVYTGQFNRENGGFRHSATPFKGSDDSPYYPGESTVRDGLRTAREQGWFSRWSKEDQAALLEWMRLHIFQLTPEMHRGLAYGSISAGNALDGYFRCCYGNPAEWTDALRAWHAEELASYGLAVEAASAFPEGIMSYTLNKKGNETSVHVTQFTSAEIPEELSAALTHPKLEGWTLLCGAYYDDVDGDAEWEQETGLLAFEKDGERLLVQMGRKAQETAWKLYPVSKQALLKERELYITCDPLTNRFQLIYPLSPVEEETFTLRSRFADMEEYSGMLCTFEEYSRINRLDGTGIRISRAYNGYQATVYRADGTAEQTKVEKAMSDRFHLMDAESFPTTVEALENLPEVTAPAGYGVTAGVHLRAQTSSRSKDLGEYHSGTLVEILGEEDGDPYNWYRVRIGSVEGYMCSVYVDYEDSVCSMQPLAQHESLKIAETLAPVKLKSGVGWFDKTVTELPAGTRMHVLAERGNWLHVMIPQGEIGWLMDINGTDGYIRREDVRIGLTSLQLDWME